MSNMNLPRVQLLAGEHELYAHVARTPEERSLGLMFRRDLPEDEGMLFMCDERAVQKFWMKDTPLPLSIAFLDEDGTIVKLDDMDPHALDGCSSEHPVRWVLEVNQGWFAERAIPAGTRLSGPPFLPQESA
ncbi:MAG: hypothetical protein JWP65_840 [Ramlibacter sp.]|jgi:uncharacterized membrane protein (UPF0127 family)|nr:hypothetical protein [Ramlibacter sp.]